MDFDHQESGWPAGWLGRKAPDSQKWKGSKESRHDAKMWLELLETMAVRSACIGIRRRKFPFQGFSDASFAG